MKITNIKHKLLKNKFILIIDNTDTNTLDLIAKKISLNSCIVILETGNDNDNATISFAYKIRQLCSIYNSLLFIKSRADIALFANADGIILDGLSANIHQVEKILDKDIIYGYSFKEPSEFDLRLAKLFDIVSLDFQNNTSYNFIQSLQKEKINYFIYKNNEKIKGVE